MSTEEDIQRRKRMLDARRPFSAETLAALNHWLDVELTYTSNALEGNSLTRSETAIVLEKGMTVGGKPLKDHLEATGHLQALVYMRELATTLEPVREMDIRNLHRLILEKIAPDEAGRYSQHQRFVAGSDLRLPSPTEVPPLMREFASWLSAAEPTPETAFDAHEKLVTIHPFTDGNGRSARLLMNLVLIRGGYPPLVLPPEERPAYHEALEAVQTRSDRAAWHAFMFRQLGTTLDRLLALLGA